MNGPTTSPGGNLPNRLVRYSLTSCLFVATTATAHMAPTGWFYPLECCGDRDCYAVSGSGVVEGPGGYFIQATGETIGYRDVRVKISRDSHFHLCLTMSEISSSTKCLFVPPRSV